jgi:hypothetical protein
MLHIRRRSLLQRLVSIMLSRSPAYPQLCWTSDTDRHVGPETLIGNLLALK